MLITDASPGDPVMAHVGMLSIGGVDLAPSGDVRFDFLAGLELLVLEVLEVFGLFEIEVDAAVGSVHFEGVEVFAAAGVAGGLEEAEGTVVEMAVEQVMMIQVCVQTPIMLAWGQLKIFKTNVRQ